jgi:hypothetical protein
MKPLLHSKTPEFTPVGSTAHCAPHASLLLLAAVGLKNGEGRSYTLSSRVPF